MPDVIKGRFHKEYELVVYGLNPLVELNLKYPGIEIERLSDHATIFCSLDIAQLNLLNFKTN